MRHDGKCVKKLIYLMSPIKKNVIYFFRIYCKGITWRDFKWISSATFTNVFKTEEVKQAFERVLKSKKKTTDRSSQQKVSCEKCAFKYFAKFARKGAYLRGGYSNISPIFWNYFFPKYEYSVKKVLSALLCLKWIIV